MSNVENTIIPDSPKVIPNEQIQLFGTVNVDVVQTPGNRSDAVMSQQATSSVLSMFGDDILMTYVKNNRQVGKRYTPNVGDELNVAYDLSAMITSKLLCNSRIVVCNLNPYDYSVYLMYLDNDDVITEKIDIYSELVVEPNVNFVITIKKLDSTEISSELFDEVISVMNYDRRKILDIVQTTGDSETAVMSQKAVTDELYSELPLTWEDGAINGTSGEDAESDSVVCRVVGYFDVRAIHSVSVITAKQIFVYDEHKRFITHAAITANTTLYKSDILALGDVTYFRIRSSWNQSAETVDKVTILESISARNTIPYVDAVQEQLESHVITKYLAWKQGYVGGGGVVYDGNSKGVYVNKMNVSGFVKVNVGNNLFVKAFAYDADGALLGDTGAVARNSIFTQSDLLGTFPTACEMQLMVFYSNNIDTPVADVEQYAHLYCTTTEVERAKTEAQEYWKKQRQRQRFNDKPIMIAYSNGADLGYINTEMAYINAAIAGFRWLKGDVQPTSDGKLVMCHDDGFTFDADGYITAYNANSENTRVIHDMTYAECMASEYATTYHIDTTYVNGVGTKVLYRPKVCDLEKFLIVCKEYEVRPYIVIRNNYMNVVVPELLRLLEAYGFTDHCIVNSFKLESVKQVAEQSKHRVMISVVKGYNNGQALTRAEVDNLLAVSPNCTINIYAQNPSATWSNALLADASKDAIEYAHSKGVVVGTAFVKEPHELFSKGIGLMQCDTLCVPIKVTPVYLCIALKDGAATVKTMGAYGRRYTADVAVSGKNIRITNIRLLGSTRDFADAVPPYLANVIPYSLSATGDNVASVILNYSNRIDVVFDTAIASLDTSTEKRIFVKFVYGM